MSRPNLIAIAPAGNLVCYLAKKHTIDIPLLQYFSIDESGGPARRSLATPHAHHGAKVSRQLSSLRVPALGGTRPPCDIALQGSADDARPHRRSGKGVPGPVEPVSFGLSLALRLKRRHPDSDVLPEVVPVGGIIAKVQAGGTEKARRARHEGLDVVLLEGGAHHDAPFDVDLRICDPRMVDVEVDREDSVAAENGEPVAQVFRLFASLSG